MIVPALSLHFERVRRSIHALIAPLTLDELWRNPFGYGNSVGHLLLHLTGNLNYYIGARIAGTGYVRDRPREFSDQERRPKEVVAREFDAAVNLALSTLAAQSESDWSRPFEAVGADDIKDRLSMFVRCLAHLDHHAGQMIYLSKELAKAREGGSQR
jgi:uncharacterized damage-inducible protein DinB